MKSLRQLQTMFQPVLWGPEGPRLHTIANVLRSSQEAGVQKAERTCNRLYIMSSFCHLHGCGPNSQTRSKQSGGVQSPACEVGSPETMSVLRRQRPVQNLLESRPPNICLMLPAHGLSNRQQ